MKITKPPQDVTARVPGEAYERLKQYHQYQKDLGAKWELKEMIGALLDACLADDADFLAWQKRQGKRPAVALDANGAATNA
jgi:hypothetical protein